MGKKIRIYYDQSNNVERIEWDPEHFEDGAYSNDFHPNVYLVDRNDVAQGYENVPDWIVIDDSELPDYEIKYLRISAGKVVADSDAATADAAQAQAGRQRDLAALRRLGGADSEAKDILERIARALGLVD